MEKFVLGTIIEANDAEHPGMLKVSTTAVTAEAGEVFWAKVLVPYAGNGYGAYFMPEAGDTVVVGFLGESCTPIVMGCLLSGADNVSSEMGGNRTKTIHTKDGHQIAFMDGDDGVLTVETKDGQFITLSDKDKSVKLATSGGKSTIVLQGEKAAVEIFADQKVSIKATEIVLDGRMTVKGRTVSIEAATDLSLKGSSAKIAAQTLEAKGTASTKLESGGMLTIKGAMTKIN